MAIVQNPNGSLGLLTSSGGLGGVFSNIYLSQDNATTWREITGPFKVKFTFPRRTMNGDILVLCGVFGKTMLQRSNDGGQTWATKGDYDIGYGLVPLPSGKLFRVHARQLGVAIASSSDEGATWKEEPTLLFPLDGAAKPAK